MQIGFISFGLFYNTSFETEKHYNIFFDRFLLKYKVQKICMIRILFFLRIYIYTIFMICINDRESSVLRVIGSGIDTIISGKRNNGHH